jgi:haloalkane dehalogenase
VLRTWDKPFLTAFSDADPVTRQFRERFISAVPGAHGQPHPLLEGGGHFLQEDVGPRLGHAVVDLLEST